MARKDFTKDQMDKFVRLVERRRGVLRLTAEDFFFDAGIHEKTFANAKRDLWMTEKTFSKLLDAMQLEENSEQLARGVFGEEDNNQRNSPSQKTEVPQSLQKGVFKPWFTGLTLLVLASTIATMALLGERNIPKTGALDPAPRQTQEIAHTSENGSEIANQFRIKLQNAQKSEEIACTSDYCVVSTSRWSLICDEAVRQVTTGFAGQTVGVPRFPCSKNETHFYCVRIREGLRVGASRELQVGFHLVDGSEEIIDVKVGGIIDFSNNETFFTNDLSEGIGVLIQTRCRE